MQIKHMMSSLDFEQNRAYLFFSSVEIAPVLVDGTDGAGTDVGRSLVRKWFGWERKGVGRGICE